jgi:hypothetical protein
MLSTPASFYGKFNIVQAIMGSIMHCSYGHLKLDILIQTRLQHFFYIFYYVS